MRGKSLNPVLLVASSYLAVIALMITFPQFFTGFSPDTTAAKAVFQAPNSVHLFGTDQVGRDVFSRVVYGARTSVLLGVIAAGSAAIVGGIIGIIGAKLHSKVQPLFLRTLDALMALPEFLIALLIIAYIGVGAAGVTVAVIIATIPGYAKVASFASRQAFASQSYVTAKVLGIRRVRRLSRYLLPQVFRPLIAVAVLGVGVAVLMIGGMTFLGLGLDAATADWGVMLGQGKLFVHRGWWALLFPGLFLTFTVAAITIVGKQLQTRWVNGGS